MKAQYSKEQISSLKEYIVGKKIEDLEYCEEENYFIIVFKTGEFSFKFMSQLVQEGK